jgi:hypothetical protein
MSEEKIVVPALRKQQLSKLASALGELGFTSITYTNERLVVERVQGEDLQGKPNLDYRITFLEKTIEMVYDIPPNVSKRVRMLELLPVLMNVLTLSEEYYEVKPSAIFSQLIALLSDISKVVGRDAVELSAELEELRAKTDSLNARYQDLVGSSEENARILLECERRRDELRELLEKLRAMSDERLREELYGWLKMHNGDIDIVEFGKAHSVPPGRVEDGLNMLIKEGYIKRKVE